MKSWAQSQDRALAIRQRRGSNQPTRGANQHAHSSQPPPAFPQTATLQLTDMLQATTRLALQTARQVRVLQGQATRTILYKDSGLLGHALQTLASPTKGWHENNAAFMWARLILLIIEHIPDAENQAVCTLLKQHADAFNQVEQLRDLILECSVHRAWNGESTIIRLATCPDLLNIERAITSTLVAHGGEVKFGPPPKGPLERAASSALEHFQR